MIEVSNQMLMFFQSCLLGIGLGLLYDVFRIIRIAVKTNSIIIFIEDIIYFIIVAVITFIFMIIQTEGQMRVFILFGELIGAILYYFTFGFVIIRVANKIIKFVKMIFSKLFKYFILPILKLIYVLYKSLYNFIFKINLKIKKVKENNKYNLKKKGILLYNLLDTRKSSKSKGKSSDVKNKKKIEKI